jgi:hypothetical protein
MILEQERIIIETEEGFTFNCSMFLGVWSAGLTAPSFMAVVKGDSVPKMIDLAILHAIDYRDRLEEFITLLEQERKLPHGQEHRERSPP